MGTWGYGILDNDTSSSIREDFYELYNEGADPAEISERLIRDNGELIQNPDDSNNFWFAIAYAQWETKSLSSIVYDKVKNLIESENDLEVWRELEAAQTDIDKRKVTLEQFLVKLQTQRKTARKREKKREVVATPVFQKGTCLTFRLANGNFGGAIVLEEHEDAVLGGRNLIASTRINMSSKPTLVDYRNSTILTTNFFQTEPELNLIWYPADSYYQYNDLFEVVGSIKVWRRYKYGGTGTRTTAGWEYIATYVDRQFEFEVFNAAPKTGNAKKYIGHWWKFW